MKSKKYTLVEKKRYEADRLPENIFDELDKAFPPRKVSSDWGISTMTFRPYNIHITGVNRMISTDAKEVQEFLEKRLKK